MAADDDDGLLVRLGLVAQEDYGGAADDEDGLFVRLLLVAQGDYDGAADDDGLVVRLGLVAQGDYDGAADVDDGLLVRVSPVAHVNKMSVHDCVLLRISCVKVIVRVLVSNSWLRCGTSCSTRLGR